MLPSDCETDRGACVPVAFASALGAPYHQLRALFAMLDPGLHLGAGVEHSTVDRVLEYYQSAQIMPRPARYCRPSRKARVVDLAARLPSGDYVFMMDTHAFHLRVAGPRSCVVTPGNRKWLTRTRVRTILQILR